MSADTSISQSIFSASAVVHGDHEGEIDVRGLVLILWRRKFIILACLLLAFGIAFVALLFVQPQYTARALVLIDSDSGSSGFSQEFQALLSNVRPDNSMVLSEIEIIRSRSLAQRIVAKKGLHLLSDPELNPNFKNLDQGSRFKPLSLSIEDLPSVERDKIVDMIVSRFLARLNVRVLPGSNAVQIEYSSIRPKRAAQIANAIADVYIEQRLDTKFASAQKMTSWLNLRLSELKNQVRESEARVVRYKADNNLVESARSEATTGQLNQLNGQLAAAKARRAKAEAQYEQIADVQNNFDKIETLPGIFNSVSVRRLKSELSALQSQVGELKTRYGAKHPRMIETQSRIEAVRGNLRAEVSKTVQSIKSEMSLAQIQVETLQENLESLSGKSLDQGDVMIKLRELEREVVVNQLTYDKFLETHKRSSGQEELQDAGAEILSYAVEPAAPVHPNKPLMMSLSVVFGMFVGLGLALLLEKLDHTFRSGGQLTHSTGLPCFGLIPILKGKDQKEMAAYVLSRPASVLAESVKSLRTALRLRVLSKSGEPAKVVTVTSSFPGEGKTTLSVWMARLAAKSGEKVLLIDADLRRPNVHKQIPLSDAAGSVVDYLSGQKTLDEVVQKDDPSGLFVIRSASVPNSALDLVNDAKMKDLIVLARERYDLVIVDSPATLAVSDSCVLASLSDLTLYNVAWKKTPREAVLNGVKQFSDIGYDRLAFVMTGVDPKRQARYGYGDVALAQGRYKEYFNH